ncbi:hypothetical protein STEG23_031189, partial [Scotinomys teguina]
MKRRCRITSVCKKYNGEGSEEGKLKMVRSAEKGTGGNGKSVKKDKDADVCVEATWTRINQVLTAPAGWVLKTVH